MMSDEIERGNAVVIASDSFAIDDAGARTQASQSIDDQRKATGEIIARAAVEPHSRALLPSNNPKAMCLISCRHWPPDGSFVVLMGKARRDEPGREGTLQHAEQIKLDNGDCNLMGSALAFLGMCELLHTRSGAYLLSSRN